MRYKAFVDCDFPWSLNHVGFPREGASYKRKYFDKQPAGPGDEAVTGAP